MQYLEIGQIVNTFGIKGFVKIYPYVDDITRDDIGNVLLAGASVFLGIHILDELLEEFSYHHQLNHMNI